MVKNDKQYQITKNKLKEFNDALLEVERKKDIDPLLKNIQVEAIKSQIENFKNDIKEYELLKKGCINHIFIEALTDIHEALIKGRIAKGWSQAELANKVNLKEQQIQRYESCNYSTASIPRIKQIIEVMDLKLAPCRVELKRPFFDIPQGVDVDMAQKKLRELKALISI